MPRRLQGNDSRTGKGEGPSGLNSRKRIQKIFFFVKIPRNFAVGIAGNPKKPQEVNVFCRNFETLGCRLLFFRSPPRGARC